jgi:hypothetical protein
MHDIILFIALVIGYHDTTCTSSQSFFYSQFTIFFFSITHYPAVFHSSGSPSFLTPVALDEFTLLYRPPADVCSEFEIEQTTLPAGTGSYQPAPVPCACMLLLLRGGTFTVTDTSNNTSEHHKEGTVLFVPAHAQVTVAGGAEGALFYRAHVNLGGTLLDDADDAHGNSNGYSNGTANGITYDSDGTTQNEKKTRTA